MGLDASILGSVIVFGVQALHVPQRSPLISRTAVATPTTILCGHFDQIRQDIKGHS